MATSADMTGERSIAVATCHDHGPRRVRSRVPLRGCVSELLGPGMIGLVLIALFGRLVVPGVLGHQRDTGAYYYPLTAWFAQELQSGRFPLWCPLIFGGYPLLADGEIGMLYPANLLALLALPSEVAFVGLQAAHYFIAGVGAYALVRTLGAGRLAAAYAGLCFTLGGFMVGHLDHGNILRTAAWLPVLLCCAERGLRARGRRVLGWTALAAATLALAALGLHPQVLLIDLVALWSYLPLRAAALAFSPGAQPRPGSLGRAAARCAMLLGGVTLLGLTGAAVQLVPSYELGTFSTRGQGLPYSSATAGALSPFDLVTVVLPYFFRADPRNVWSLHPYWEVTLYIGVPGLLLALVGLALGARRVVLPLAGLVLLGLALGMADRLPIDLYHGLWTLPGFSWMRAPGRYGLVIELGLAVLAGLGLDRLLAESGTPRGRRVARGTSALALGLIAILVGARLWVEANRDEALRAISDVYLALPRDRPALSAERVWEGLSTSLNPANWWTGLALSALLSLVGFLWCWQRWPGRGRHWRAGIVALAASELVLVAHGFHPTASLAALDEPSARLRFLSARDGLWRAFITGRSDSSLTARPALFGIAQAYGYSSLPTRRVERYWTRVHEVDDELLDLWNVRYVVESERDSGRISAQGIIFDPARPLLDGPAASPMGHEVFRVAPTRADSLRLLSSMDEAAHLPDGTTVAEVVISGGDWPPETLTVRLGEHTAEAAHDAGELPRPAHSRAPVGHLWEPRDPLGRVYPRNVYVADLVLARPRSIEQVEVRTIAPGGRFRLAGLGLQDRDGWNSASLLRVHRKKYRTVYDDGSTTIYENDAALPRAFVVGEAVMVAEDDWSLPHLLRGGFDIRRQVLLETLPPGRPRSSEPSEAPELHPRPAAADAAPRGATVERYEADRIVVRATAPLGGYLVLTDSYYPGWRAWVDGVPVRVERANYLFRAVELPPGAQVVEFRFEPTIVYLGGLLSLAAWLTMAGLGAATLTATGGSDASRIHPPSGQPRTRARGV